MSAARSGLGLLTADYTHLAGGKNFGIYASNGPKDDPTLPIDLNGGGGGAVEMAQTAALPASQENPANPFASSGLLTATVAPSLAVSMAASEDRQQLLLAREVVSRLKASDESLRLAFSHPDLSGQEIAWQASFRSGATAATSFPSAKRIELSFTRPKFPPPANEDWRKALDYRLVANDLDPAMRVLIPLVKAVLGIETTGYEGDDVGTMQHFSFRFIRKVEVPNEHSYNQKASVDVRFSRNTGMPGTPVPDSFPITIIIEVAAMSNDQPITRKGYRGYDQDFNEVIAESNVFAPDGYYMSDALADEALAQLMARLIDAGVVNVGS